MKNNQLSLMLTVILLISVLGSCWLAFSYNSSIKKLREAQRTVMTVERNRQALRVFVADLVEYSKTHPSINPLLQSIGVGGQAPASAPTPTPPPATPPKAPATTKPAGK